MVTNAAQLPLPLNLPERPKPMPALPQVTPGALASADMGPGMGLGTQAGSGVDDSAAGGFDAQGRGDTDAQDASGARTIASQQTASLFAARLTMDQGLNFPPLDTREVGDQDIIDPQRPTARIPDPLLSVEEAKAGAEAPLPAPEPLISPEEARAESVAPVPTPVELSAIADAKGTAAETPISRANAEDANAPLNATTQGPERTATSEAQAAPPEIPPTPQSPKPDETPPG